MTTKWRPEGWFNEYENAVIEPGMSVIKAACLELGADRMLEKLRERVKLTRYFHIGFRPIEKGNWVFIPDDK